MGKGKLPKNKRETAKGEESLIFSLRAWQIIGGGVGNH